MVWDRNKGSVESEEPTGREAHPGLATTNAHLEAPSWADDSHQRGTRNLYGEEGKTICDEVK